FKSFSGGILVNRNQSRNADTFREQLPHAVSRRLGSDHGDIDVGGRGDLPEVNVEAVGKHQGFAGGEIGRDIAGVQIALHVVRNQDHHDVGSLGRFGGREHLQS